MQKTDFFEELYCSVIYAQSLRFPGRFLTFGNSRHCGGGFYAENNLINREIKKKHTKLRGELQNSNQSPNSTDDTSKSTFARTHLQF